VGGYFLGGAMDSIDSQIKALQRKKAKIAMLRDVQKLISEIKDNDDHEGLKDEVRALFDGVINNEVLAIQNGPAKTPRAERVQVEETSQPETAKEEVRQSSKPAQPRVDLVAFVRQYSHLGFKKVRATTLQGEQVTGTVMKVEYPNILVQGADGNAYECNPETANLEG